MIIQISAFVLIKIGKNIVYVDFAVFEYSPHIRNKTLGVDFVANNCILEFFERNGVVEVFVEHSLQKENVAGSPVSDLSGDVDKLASVDGVILGIFRKELLQRELVGRAVAHYRVSELDELSDVVKLTLS